MTRPSTASCSSPGSGTPFTLVDTDFDLCPVQAAWSPDGKALSLSHAIFTVGRDYNERKEGVLHIVNVDGSGLSAVPNVKYVMSSAWRPQ
jgi:hypothetical protein